MRPLFVRKPRFRTQASRILLTSASSLIYQKSIMQSRSVPSVGSSLSRLIYSFVCVFVCLFYLFFFYPSPSETRRLFLLEQRPGRCDGRAESQHKEQKSTGKHLFYMCDCCPVSHLNEKKKQKLSISAGSGCLLKKTLLINSSFYFFLQSNSVFTFCAWCFRESN